MSEWKEYRLGDVCEITSSKRIFYSEYVSCGIPFYRSKEIIDLYNRRNISTELYISEERFMEIKEKFGVPVVGDILLTSVGTLGIPYIVKENDKFYFKDGNLTWFRNLCADKILSEYFVFWLTSSIGRQKLDEISIGSTQAALTISGLKSIDILLPPLEKQKEIAAILSSLDEKIDLLNRQNTTLESMAETLFRQHFIEGAQPDWVDGKLKDYCDIKIGRTPPRKEHQWFSTSDIDVKWISIKDMGCQGAYIFNTSERLTNEAVVIHSVPIIPKETVVLSFKMTVGRVSITSEEMVSNEAIAHFILKKETQLSKELLYLFLKQFNYDTLGSTSSIVTAINSAMIKDIEITMPDINTLKIFDKAVLPMFKKIKQNQKQIITLSNLRDALLPKLMSNEIKL